VKYLIIVEKAGENYSAYVPDLPGCIAAADTFEETERLIREGIAIYIEELQAAGEPIPPPTTRAAEVDVPISA
jgi:predicted RNase H-like HicB family nuclease